MPRSVPALSLVGAASAFGATCLALALVGLGLPFLLAAFIAALCAGLLLYATARWILGGPEQRIADPDRLAPGPALEARIRQIEESSAHLRHDLRGVLSPALMMADRLLKNDDPAIRRAGQAVVRSVERATALLAENKKQTAGEAQGAEPDAAAPSRPRQPAESDARAR